MICTMLMIQYVDLELYKLSFNTDIDDKSKFSEEIQYILQNFAAVTKKGLECGNAGY